MLQAFYYDHLKHNSHDIADEMGCSVCNFQTVHQALSFWSLGSASLTYQTASVSRSFQGWHNSPPLPSAGWLKFGAIKPHHSSLIYWSWLHKCQNNEYRRIETSFKNRLQVHLSSPTSYPHPAIRSIIIKIIRSSHKKMPFSNQQYLFP